MIPPEARAVLDDKLAHAQAELRAALDTRARLADALNAEADPASWSSIRLRTELHVVDLRVDLYRQVIAELRSRLGLR